MSKPPLTSYPEYFQRYISQVKENDLKEAFKNQMPAAEAFLQTIDEEFRCGWCIASGSINF